MNNILLNVELPKFSGKGTDINKHFQNLEDVQTLLMWNEARLMEMLPIAFVGRHRKRLEVQLNKTQGIDSPIWHPI